MSSMRAKIRSVTLATAATTAIVLASPIPAMAQPAVWQVADLGTSASAGAHTTGAFDGPCDVPFGTPAGGTSTLVGLQQPFFAHDMGLENYASCHEVTSCVLSGTGNAAIWIDGIGTPTLRIHWDGMSQSHHSCHTARAYTGQGIAGLASSLGLTPVGVPNGTPVTVHFSWWQGSTNNFHPEIPAAPEDVQTRVFGTSLSLNGAPLFAPGFFNLINIKGAGFLANTVVDPTFAATAGTQYTLTTTYNTDAFITNPGNPPPGVPPNDDDELTSYMGEIVLSLVGPVTAAPQNGEIDFSVDMGSDTSLAPVAPSNANEVFDPGDMYPMGGAALPAGGADGVRDDASFEFGADPRPVCPGAPIADVCSGLTVPPTEMSNLDVDGSDSLDPTSVSAIQAAINAGNLPLAQSPSTCIRHGDFLLVSFDDDTATHVYDNAVCSAPSAATSTRGLTYGSTAAQDEVLEANVMTVLQPGFAPLHLAATFPVASESQVHVSLGPNPPAAFGGAQGADDDVDALDERGTGCSTWLFSVDHEADFNLDPGTIYRATAGGPVPFVTEANLGIPVGTDVRDFEFAITRDNNNVDVLTLLYTVAPDDPLTGNVDESSGMDPTMIYASYLNGGSFPYLDQPIPQRPVFAFSPALDGIDALTVLARPLAAVTADTDGDGFSGAQDCLEGDPTVWAVPAGPPQNLSIDHNPSTNAATLSWTPPASPGGTATIYDVYRSVYNAMNALPPVFACRAPDTGALTLNETTMPAKKQAFLYVLRAQDACGTGPVGTSAGGHTPVVPACP